MISFNFVYLKNIYPVVVWAVLFPSVLPLPTHISLAFTFVTVWKVT